MAAAKGGPMRRPRTKGVLGSQAVIQIAEAVDRLIGSVARDLLLQDAQFKRLPDWNESVLEDKVAALHQALRHRYPEVAEAVGRSAGKATTDYLLDNRISARAQELISMAPRARSPSGSWASQPS